VVIRTFFMAAESPKAAWAAFVATLASGGPLLPLVVIWAAAM
jgi:hypothetical protein